MKRKDLESAVAKVTYQRGLIGIPVGLLFILTGLGNLRWGPFVNPWLFIGCLAVIGIASLAVYRYYNDNYGRATLSRKRQIRYAVAFVPFAASMIGGPILDTQLDLPISLFASGFALAMLVWFATSVGLQLRHVIVWGALLVVGLLPIWGGQADKVSVAWLPMGVACIVAGILDHLALVRSFGPAVDRDAEDSAEESNVGA